jgi:lipopolysaccharide transport system permease protein
MFTINVTFGLNYGYLGRSDPGQPTILDLLGPWPLRVVYLLAALTVSYRDFRYVIPFGIQALMYASPIIYPVQLVPERYQWLLGINPMAGLIDAYRSVLLGKPWNLSLLAVSAASTVFCLVIGIIYFRSTERRFADIA